MDNLLTLAAVLATLLIVGGVIGLLDRRRFDPRWLLIAALLVLIEDALVTRGYGVIPRVIGGHWNWQGKLTALAATLVIAALPAFGWRRVGLTLRQTVGSQRACATVAVLYLLWFVVAVLLFPNDAANGETIAFQMTLPGFEEEPFFRGTLLFALDRAFAGRVRWLGVDWGWGALLSSVLFGLDHALSQDADGFGFNALVMAFTGVPALLAVWLRLRSGSLVWPIALHNFGNTIGFLI